MKYPKDADQIKYRIPSVYIFFVIILVIISIWIIASLAGLIPVEELLLNFTGFISMLVSITMLAVLGAIFLGMYLSHRMLTKKGFTPFEISMLEMHEDIKELKKRLTKIENEIKNKNNK